MLFLSFMTVFNVLHQQRTNKAKVFDLQIYTWPTKLVTLILLDLKIKLYLP